MGESPSSRGFWSAPRDIPHRRGNIHPDLTLEGVTSSFVKMRDVVMVKWILTPLIAMVAVAGVGGSGDGQSPTAPTGVGLDPVLGVMLARAIQDEYRAETHRDE
jgi:hypothetical protein